jgi:hypothetical protein
MHDMLAQKACAQAPACLAIRQGHVQCVQRIHAVQLVQLPPLTFGSVDAPGACCAAPPTPPTPPLSLPPTPEAHPAPRSVPCIWLQTGADTDCCQTGSG